MLEIDQQIDNHNFKINCKKDGDKLNIFIKYEEYDLKGFILKIWIKLKLNVLLKLIFI